MGDGGGGQAAVCSVTAAWQAVNHASRRLQRRVRLLGALSREEAMKQPIFMKADEALLRSQVIDANQPGTILRDF